MAIGVYFAPPAVSAEKYSAVLKALQKAGAAHPPGRSYHASFGAKDKLMVFEVWTSQKAFEKFGKTLMPTLQSFGIDPGQPQVMPINKVITPAARSASPARKTAKAAKKAKTSRAVAGRRR
jgi:hypothetical protein